MKPIRVFWSPLSNKFYASRAYKQTSAKTVLITGDKFIEFDLVFKKKD